MDAIIYFFIIEVAAFAFIKIFRAGFPRKKSLQKPSSEASEAQQIVAREQQDFLQKKALFREYLQTQKDQPEPPIEQKRTPKPPNVGGKRYRKLPRTLESKRPPEKTFTEKPKEASHEVPVKECPHSFGYLRTISEGLVPEDCLTCTKLLDCRNKS